MILDMVNLDSIEIEFTLSQPFKPLQQLIAVLPTASRRMLPRPYRQFMTVYAPFSQFFFHFFFFLTR